MQRIEELDSLRGLSALSIVIFHLPWIQVGLLGTPIYLFFILSGYLVTSIILSHQPSEGFLFAFYLRRGLRIWPIYYLSLLLLVAFNPLTPRPASLDNLPHYLTFTQLITTYWTERVPAPMPAFEHTWTLAIEEQFYVLWPALILILRRKAVPAAAIALVAFAFVMRLAGLNNWILATNCDGLALGALLAAELQGRSASDVRRRSARSLILMGLAGTVWIGGTLVFRAPAGGPLGRALAAAKPLSFHFVYFAIVALTVLFAGDRRLAFLRDRRLVYLGQISYGVYLYHYIIFKIAEDWAKPHGLADGVAFNLALVGMSLLAAALSYRFIERPLLALKALVPYPSSGASGVAFSRGLVPLSGPQEG